MLSAIAVIGKNRELGCNNKLLWDIPDDLAHFRKITSGHPVIMGRKTFESIGSPLPKRTNIIITRDKNYKVEGCEIVNSIENAIEIAKKSCHSSLRHSRVGGNLSKETNVLYTQIPAYAGMTKKEKNDKECEIFIIGGSQIYKQALPFCDKLYLTIVEDKPKADTFFPDYSEFTKIISEELHEENGLKYKWIELIK